MDKQRRLALKKGGDFMYDLPFEFEEETDYFETSSESIAVSDFTEALIEALCGEE